MGTPTRLDGTHLLTWVRNAVFLLNAKRDDINALNVFPVPDADTGSNMAHTMQAALTAAESLPEKDQVSAHRVAAALAQGAVRGARGNSGVVLSQVFAGIAGAANTGCIDGITVREALAFAVELVDEAITDPVEGTVITVLRATALAARQEPETTLTATVHAAVEAAKKALAKTPSQLAVLREAGVVDAGGQGFVLLLQSLDNLLTGQNSNAVHLQIPDSTVGDLDEQSPAPGVVAAVTATHEVDSDSVCSGSGASQGGDIEVMAYLTCADATIFESLKQALKKLGTSVVVARDGVARGTVHIHTPHAAAVCELLFSSGFVSDLRMEILPVQPVATAAGARVIVALAPEGGVADLFADAGALVVHPVEPGQKNPGGDRDTVSAIISAVTAAGAEAFILVPNGLLSLRELGSAELAGHAFGQQAAIIPARCFVEGVAAVAVHEASQPFAVDAYCMSDASASVRSVEVKKAIAAAVTGAGPAAVGDWVAVAGDHDIAVDAQLTDCVIAAIETLLSQGGELVTLLLTDEARDKLDVALIEETMKAYTVDVLVYAATGMDHPVEIGVE